ncbi:MAG: dihydroorotase, partial [Holdemanella sp.]|nr:dihydroorotase [Holdemanella sp.]
AGGYTTVVLMANTKPCVDNEETLQYILNKAKTMPIHIESCATITKGMKGKELVDFTSLRKLGAAGFTDDGIPILDGKLVKQAMETAKEMDVPLSFHEEDPSFIVNNGINHGKVSEKLGIYGSPSIAEESIVARDVMIALHTGAKVNVQHISSANSLKLVRLAKDLGANVWAEVTPHHLVLNEAAVLEHGSLAKMNPPLRTEKDRLALIEGLKDGTIDMIATDHAPHSIEEKAKGLTQAPSGILGLETAFALVNEELVEKGHLTMPQLMQKMSYNPSKLYNFDGGILQVGSKADLVIFDPKKEWVIEKYHSKSENSPFTNRKLKGKVLYTICNGNIVYKAL